MNRSEKIKDNSSIDRVDEYIEEYITVYVVISAMTFSLKLKRADLLRDISLRTHLG